MKKLLVILLTLVVSSTFSTSAKFMPDAEIEKVRLPLESRHLPYPVVHQIATSLALFFHDSNTPLENIVNSSSTFKSLKNLGVLVRNWCAKIKSPKQAVKKMNWWQSK